MLVKKIDILVNIYKLISALPGNPLEQHNTSILTIPRPILSASLSLYLRPQGHWKPRPPHTLQHPKNYVKHISTLRATEDSRLYLLATATFIRSSSTRSTFFFVSSATTSSDKGPFNRECQLMQIMSVLYELTAMVVAPDASQEKAERFSGSSDCSRLRTPIAKKDLFHPYKI